MVIMEGQDFEDLLNASAHIEVPSNQGKTEFRVISTQKYCTVSVGIS